MRSSAKPFTTVTLEDGTFAVVRTDPRKPRHLEVIALFLDASRARDYADRENSRFPEPASAPKEALTRPAGEPPAATPELSARQSDVLQALRTKMDANQRVEEKAAVLAEAANIPHGSLHSVLQSLEKKGLIKTSRVGSARAPARLPGFVISKSFFIALSYVRPKGGERP